MVTAYARRITELERRVAKIEQQLGAPSEELGSTKSRRPQMLHSTERDRRLVHSETGDSDAAMVARAEELFGSLLTMNPPKLISYSEAYRRIIGPYSVWRNAVHAPEIIRLACRTPARRVAQLTVRLDALIVGKETRRPAGGHFGTASYSESDWIQTFGTWPLFA